MSITPRNRSRSTGSVSGGLHKFGQDFSRTVQCPTETCSDVIGNYPNPNGFTHLKGSWSKSVWNGDNEKPGLSNIKCDNWPFVNANTPVPNYPPVEDDTSTMTKLLARSNPGTASLQLPVSISELRDLPKMLRNAGRTVAGKGANAYLSYQFGWKPLISDLSKLLDITAQTDKQLEKLNRLTSQNGARFRANLGTVTGSGGLGSAVAESQAFFCTGSYSDNGSRHRWGSCRWFPTALAKVGKDNDAKRSLARRIAIGLHPTQGLSNLWEALPWSWLVDWFSNLGDYIQATNHGIAVPSSTACIMTQYTEERRWVIKDPPSWCVLSPPPYATLVKQYRVVKSTAVNLKFNMPILTDRQIGILASLSIVRGGK